MHTQTILIIAGALATIGATPFAFSSQTVVTRKAVVDAPTERIFEVLNSNSGFQSFNPYKSEDPNLEITLSGPESGVGSAFRFEGDGGKGTQTITAVEPNKRVEMLIDMGAFGQPRQSFTLNPTDDGTEVTWTIVSEHGLNPAKRIFGLFMDRMLGPKYERGLKTLQQSLS